MSADGYRVCPKCHAGRIIEHKNLSRELDESYGKIPAKDYLALQEKVAELEEQLGKENDYSLAEYREVWISSDGVFSVRYSGSCRKCDFTFRFDHKEQAYKNDQSV